MPLPPSPDALGPRYRPEPRHLDLGPAFFDPVRPATFPQHRLRFRNQRHAATVGLDGLDDAAWVEAMARFAPLPGNHPQPLALRYHGHQFQSYNPHLGDGRGFLYAQVRDDRDRLLDLGTKGSGTTPYSRGGDGRLTLKGGVREILATELLEARGVDTSKTLSVIETGEALDRHDEPSPTRSCVLVRLSHGHVRIGTFQRLHALGQKAELDTLLRYAAATYHPAIAQAPDLPAAFLGAVAEACADTVAAWLVAGFVHGVLNTDNINVSGESFDYGPWRFTPACDPGFTAAYFDHSGLYAFGRQAAAVAWNLERLAGTLVPVGQAGTLSDALARYRPAFGAAFVRRTVQALGVEPRGEAADRALTDAWWQYLEQSRAPFDRPWFDWYGGEAAAPRAAASPVDYRGPHWAAVRHALAGRAPADPARLSHPYWQGPAPESLIIDEVEALWEAIDRRDDWGPLHDKVRRIRAAGRAAGFGPADPTRDGQTGEPPPAGAA
ncbi:YdiU family protein [Myxococcota bacterium]|nr:YdiU family protein [Myxococcota bacterium]